MLCQLQIRDFAIVEAVELELRPGFTALTGETGAGKSILVDALLLAVGGRADSGAVRHGADRAEARGDEVRQPAAGLFNSLPLDIKTPDMAANADQASQQQGVVPVAAGRINRAVAVPHEAVQEQVRKRHRPAQNRYG